MGYLYHGHYATYYEVGRVELIRSLGLSYKSMEEERGVLMPVVSMESRFLRPARYDDLLTVHTSLKHLPDTHIIFHFEVFNQHHALVNSGRVRLCFFCAKSARVVQAPGDLIGLLTPWLGA